MHNDAPHQAHSAYREYAPADMLSRVSVFADDVHRRRTVRDFSSRPVDRAIIEHAIRAAGSAPSGANRQPWHFAVVESPNIKKQIREAAEAEEREFYSHRATDEWKDALAPLGTDANKPFLETAPYLIGVFAQKFAHTASGEKLVNYYPIESVGLATGILITALHTAGLATLTHTPSPMKFMNEIMGRPSDERPFVLLVVGYPADDCKVPAISRKSVSEISSYL
jgi:iodotyrosine deiodinase